METACLLFHDHEVTRALLRRRNGERAFFESDPKTDTARESYDRHSRFVPL
jgi:hypothetical protein